MFSYRYRYLLGYRIKTNCEYSNVAVISYDPNNCPLYLANLVVSMQSLNMCGFHIFRNQKYYVNM